MQLIRLGDASNFSHGRTSASTLDDAFSGAADAASSTGATSDGEDFSEDEDELPARSRQRLDSSPMLPPGTAKRPHKRLDDILPSFDSSDASCDEDDYRHDEPADSVVKSELDDDIAYKDAPKAKKAKTRATSTTSTNNSKSRGSKPAPVRQNKSGKNGSTTGASRKIKSSSSVNGNQKATTTANATATVTSPGMVSPAPTRKTSMSSVNFQHQLAADEEDLSTKPRCQRCRKSKKGCDRQRPCGRCKDAGIGIQGCISEDEGNGRKGRYGRHMGVPVKKAADVSPTANETQAVIASLSSSTADKNKKRKR